MLPLTQHNASRCNAHNALRWGFGSPNRTQCTWILMSPCNCCSFRSQSSPLCVHYARLPITSRGMVLLVQKLVMPTQCHWQVGHEGSHRYRLQMLTCTYKQADRRHRFHVAMPKEHTSTHTRTHQHTPTRTNTHQHTPTHTNTHTSTHTYTYTHLQAGTQTHRHVPTPHELTEDNTPQIDRGTVSEGKHARTHAPTQFHTY